MPRAELSKFEMADVSGIERSQINTTCAESSPLLQHSAASGAERSYVFWPGAKEWCHQQYTQKRLVAYSVPQNFDGLILVTNSDYADSLLTDIEILTSTRLKLRTTGTNECTQYNCGTMRRKSQVHTPNVIVSWLLNGSTCQFDASAVDLSGDVLCDFKTAKARPKTAHSRKPEVSKPEVSKPEVSKPEVTKAAGVRRRKASVLLEDCTACMVRRELPCHRVITGVDGVQYNQVMVFSFQHSHDARCDHNLRSLTLHPLLHQKAHELLSIATLKPQEVLDQLPVLATELKTAYAKLGVQHTESPLNARFNPSKIMLKNTRARDVPKDDADDQGPKRKRAARSIVFAAPISSSVQ
eukprot:TRINITY_DN4621_c0_g1_i2.p1 TRINITY_DN4621_c0_g1~~TRINITY_DN4621_c0_g1_i2.p1  ORF type:complete len:354 (+),score=38.81 TRINITY_DN4621_c0_g1_i2:79-1140(+)